MNQKGYISIIFILIIVLLLVGIYYLTKKQRILSPLNQITPTPSITVKLNFPTPIYTIDNSQTNNWNKYSSTKYSYSISYPPDWHLEPKCDGGIPEEDYICILSPNFTKISSTDWTRPDFKGVKVIIDNQKDFIGYPPDQFCKLQFNHSLYECKKITYRNWSGWLITWAPLIGFETVVEGPPRTDIGILKNDKFIMKLSALYSNDSKELLSIVNMMLSTVTFTENYMSNPKIDWNTYEDIKYKFRIEYPVFYTLKTFSYPVYYYNQDASPPRNEPIDTDFVKLYDMNNLKKTNSNYTEEISSNILISFWPNPLRLPIDEWIKYSSKYTSIYSTDNVPIKSEKFAGEDAVFYSFSGTRDFDTILVEKDKSTYIIDLSCTLYRESQYEMSKIKNDCQDIFSTFEFIN